MIMKKIQLLIICALVFSMAACSSKNVAEPSKRISTGGYDVVECSYAETDVATEKSIHIKYPKIVNLNNHAIEQNVNSQIADLALSALNEFTSLDKMTIGTEYQVTLKSNSLLSVRFIVSSFHKIQAYPLIRVKTINIDVSTGKKLKLDDIVNVDSNFKNAFFDVFKNNRKYEAPVDDEFYGLINDYVKGIVSVNNLKACDEKLNDDFHSYLTTDSVGISIAVPHSGGSYALYEAKYSDVPLRADFQKLVHENIAFQEKTRVVCRSVNNFVCVPISSIVFRDMSAPSQPLSFSS